MWQVATVLHYAVVDLIIIQSCGQNNHFTVPHTRTSHTRGTWLKLSQDVWASEEIQTVSFVIWMVGCENQWLLAAILPAM